ncbi:sugar ABC transporter ATP-binding protein [Proteiniclasticum sp.]|uniref:sugar ABC transporter ATP-binding protein n=1 Tax=Proteiniclasticum sp. TaxID=2053595 RepID=UPI00289CAC57|nr:sugar ABC transporter ATP-binding protein [Proteiniclasticum sp.]
MTNIYKSFGENEVLKDVFLNIRGGEVLALIGENGAGKSTLMNILGGVLPMDSGKIMIDGKESVFQDPKHSMEAGIAFIHQELNLINDLPIYENMFIGREPKTKHGTLDLERMLKETQEVFIRMNIKLNPKAMVRDLDASYKQIVEIARAMMMNASVIIMDEPTTSLTETEIERVFHMMKTLKEHNVGIIFISHKLNEVMKICDRYMVLRDGVLVGEGKIEDVSTDELARLMVGHAVRTEALQRHIEKREEVLRVENLSKDNDFRDVSFTAYKGEILGVTGLLGDGRSELFLSIFGADRYESGQVYLEGKPVKIRSTVDAMKMGIGYLPRNRKENGILKDMNIYENASIVTWPKFAKRGIIDRRTQVSEFEKQVRRLRIKMGRRTDSINSLSGGNQQKVVLSKWLTANPRILVLDNPTQGVDVGAKEDIYDIIMDLIDDDIAVIVLSSEAQEIIRVCDRALVMYHGNIQGEVRGEEMNEHNIMKLATGGSLS